VGGLSSGEAVAGPSRTYASARDVLKTVFGYESFRGHQAEVVEALLAGEDALVPASSPISRTGVLFYETLFDENAACHIALGQAYAVTVKGGANMSAEQKLAAGLNDSLTHVDFMIGSARMDIDGELPSGELEPVMRGGEWVD